MGSPAISTLDYGAAPGSDRLGERVLGYELVASLGEGSMSEVFEAIDAEGRSVAVKILRAEWAHRDDVRARFEREAQALARIDDPHVVKVLEATALSDGTPAQIIEYLDGLTLEEYVDAGQVVLRDAIIIAKQLAQGLVAAHRSGVVHRDLKPENVVVLFDGGDLCCKILDFGIARTNTGTHLTVPGSILGTPSYMAPEQAAPGRVVDARADIYALGCILYELVTDEVPFECFDPMQVILAHIGKDAPDPCVLRPDCPDGLAQVIARCLEKDPARRYDDAVLLHNALEAVERGEALVHGAPLSERTSAPTVDAVEVAEPEGDMSRAVFFDPRSAPIDIAELAAMRALERDGELRPSSVPPRGAAEPRPTPPPPQPWLARWRWSVALLVLPALGAAYSCAF